MSRDVSDLRVELALSAEDEQQYEEIGKVSSRVISVLVDYDTFDEDLMASEVNDLYEHVLSSDEYSYDVKSKAVLLWSFLEPSRLWGFKNFSGEELMAFASECVLYHANKLKDKDIQTLIANPNFGASIGSKFDVPRMAFTTPYDEMTTGQIVEQTLINQLAISPTMNLDFAALIMEVSDPRFHKRRSRETALDVSLVLDWAREIYELDESIPDAWVREFLVKVAS